MPLSRPVVYLPVIKVSNSPTEEHFFSFALGYFYHLIEEGALNDLETIFFEAEVYPIEIFEENIWYSFTPAEWAIHKNNMSVFQYFITSTLPLFDQKSVTYVLTTLTAMAIQYNNLEAVRILANYNSPPQTLDNLSDEPKRLHKNIIEAPDLPKNIVRNRNNSIEGSRVSTNNSNQVSISDIYGEGSLEGLSSKLDDGNFGLNYKGKGFLSIAVQHHASSELFRFLLNICDLREEINGIPGFNYYRTPLRSCVKFNNVNAAVLFLQESYELFGSTNSEDRDESFLALLIKKNSQEMLKKVLHEIPFLCHYRDFEGNSLYHYASFYSLDHRLVGLIHESCPDVYSDSQNNEGRTPFAIILERVKRGNTADIASKFIILGANPLIESSPKVSPFIIMVKNFFFKLFSFFIDQSPLDLKSLGILEVLVRTVSKYCLWYWLDKILSRYPDIPVEWINFTKIKFKDVLYDSAHLTFDIALKNYQLLMGTQSICDIVRSNNMKFVEVAVRNGFNFKRIDLSKFRKGEIGAVMMNYLNNVQKKCFMIEEDVVMELEEEMEKL